MGESDILPGSRMARETAGGKTSGTYRALTYLSFFGLAITVPLLLLLGALLIQSTMAQRAQLENRVLQVLDAVVNQLDRDLDRDITILRTLATSRNLASGDWQAFYEQAKAALQGRAYLVLIDTTGRQLVNTYVPYGMQPAMTGDPETLRRILQTRVPVVSNSFVSLVVKKPVFNVSIPVFEDGEVRYVMSLGLLPDDLVALLKSQNLGSEWVTSIWDANGVILARSQETQRYLGRKISQDRRERSQRDVLRTTSLDGVDTLQATERSRVSGWGVGVNIPYSIVAEQIRSSLLLWGAAAVLASAVALLLGLFFARQITTSLDSAAKASAAFGRGESFPIAGSRLREADSFLTTLREAQRVRGELTEQVRQSRDLLQITLASIADGVIATDEKGRVTFLNHVAEVLTGWTQKEAAGIPLDQIFVITNEQTAARVENPVVKVLREGQVVGLANHTKLTARNGRSVPIDDSAAPIRDVAGNILGAVLVFRDVSERRKAEKDLNESIKGLKRVNEDLNQFAFAASHDLQEPLRMITSYSQLLLQGYRGQLDGEAGSWVEFISDGTRRMHALLADLLAYTQVTVDGNHPVEPVDLNEILRSTIENCKVAIAETGAIITSDPLPAVVGYKPHFAQLLQNLISNALKYRSEDAPRVHVSAQRENGMWCIGVRDNGIGIAPQYHKQVFGVFKRLHGRSIAGTGIGLAICQRVIDRYGGRIWIESQAGEGATFYFTIPAEEAIEAARDT